VCPSGSVSWDGLSGLNQRRHAVSAICTGRVPERARATVLGVERSVTALVPDDGVMVRSLRDGHEGDRLRLSGRTEARFAR
jgi:hypothetical protein